MKKNNKTVLEIIKPKLLLYGIFSLILLGLIIFVYLGIRSNTFLPYFFYFFIIGILAFLCLFLDKFIKLLNIYKNSELRNQLSSLSIINYFDNTFFLEDHLFNIDTKALINYKDIILFDIYRYSTEDSENSDEVFKIFVVDKTQKEYFFIISSYNYYKYRNDIINFFKEKCPNSLYKVSEDNYKTLNMELGKNAKSILNIRNGRIPILPLVFITAFCTFLTTYFLTLIIKLSNSSNKLNQDLITYFFIFIFLLFVTLICFKRIINELLSKKTKQLAEELGRDNFKKYSISGTDIYISNSLLLIDNKKIEIANIKDVIINQTVIKIILEDGIEILIDRMNNSEFEDETIKEITDKLNEYRKK